MKEVIEAEKIWIPRAMPDAGPAMSDEQKFACALRHLDDLGFCENLSGHITGQRDRDDSMLINPWGLWWGEVKSSDVLRIDAKGEVIAGKWDVTPAFHLHTELHNARQDARVIVHNHPMYCSVLAAIGLLPELIHQNSSILHDEMIFVDEYDGEVASSEVGESLAMSIGSASVAMLANHGVIVIAPTIEEAVYKSVCFERACEIFVKVLSTGKTAKKIKPVFLEQIKKSQIDRASLAYWNGAVRPLINNEPEILN